MPRLTSVLMTYFIIGACFFGAGLVGYGSGVGVTGLVVTSVNGGNVQTNANTTSDINHLGGPIEQAINSVGGGGLLAAWKFVSGLINYTFWPISVLVNVHAPVQVVVLVGGTSAFGFLMGLIALFRRGA